jgi:hypothetical protein
MKAKYINPLIQFNYWSYDLIFVDENDEICFRINTIFNSEPTESDYINRVNLCNNNYELNYTIISIEH